MPRIQHDQKTIHDYFQAIYPFDTDAEIKTHQGGYLKIHLPKHPMSWTGGWFLHHRAVAEQDLGRFLYPCEQVHHIDRDRKNNSPSNLKVYTTQSEHLASEHGSGIFAKQEVIDAVLSAADDTSIPMSALPCASATARKILDAYGKTWKSPADAKNITEDQLIQAMKKAKNKYELGDLLGCCYGTLWRRFPHILVRRKTPCHLDGVRNDIYRRILSGQTFRAIAAHYGTSAGVVTNSLVRWSATGDLPIEVAKNVNSRPKCKLKL